MNLFRIKLNDDNLGYTIMENAFINGYLPDAPGNYLKVYIWALKCAQNYSDSLISNETTARALNLTTEEVISAWNYWEGKGIVKILRDPAKGNTTDYQIDLLCIREIESEGKSKTQHMSKDNPARIIDARKNPKLKELFESFKRLYGRDASTVESFTLLDWVEDYNMTPEVISLFISDCVSRNKKDLPYLKQVARIWFDNGITTLEKANDYLAQHKEKWQKYNKVINFLKIGRQPTSKEEELMYKWYYVFNFDEDIVQKACSMTVMTLKPSFNYIDKILEEWHEKGFKTLQEVEAYLLKTVKRSNPKNSGTKSTPVQKPTFNNFNNHEYDPKLLKEKLLKKGRGELSE